MFFKKYKNECAICKKTFFTFMMTKKDSLYLCNNCTNLCKKNNPYCYNALQIYSIEDLKSSIVLNKSVASIKHEKKVELYKKERKEQYLRTLSSINFIVPTETEKVKRKYLKDFPYFNYSQIRKNIPQHKLDNFVVIDTETTGLRPSMDELLEISAIKFINAIPVECLTTLVKPKKEISSTTININHITDEMVSTSPKVENIIKDFSDFIKGYNIVGYNLEFDLKFLHCNGMDFFSEKRQFYDVLQLCRKCIDKYNVPNYKLDTICDYCDLPRTQQHRATEDALVTGILFRDFGYQIKNGEI